MPRISDQAIQHILYGILERYSGKRPKFDELDWYQNTEGNMDEFAVDWKDRFQAIVTLAPFTGEDEVEEVVFKTWPPKYTDASLTIIKFNVY